MRYNLRDTGVEAVWRSMKKFLRPHYLLPLCTSQSSRNKLGYIITVIPREPNRLQTPTCSGAPSFGARRFWVPFQRFGCPLYIIAWLWFPPAIHPPLLHRYNRISMRGIKLRPEWNRNKNHNTKNNGWHYSRAPRDEAVSSLPRLGLTAVGDMLFHHPWLIVMIGSGICLNSHPPRAHWGNPAGGEKQWAESPSLHVSYTYTLLWHARMRTSTHVLAGQNAAILHARLL